MCGRYVSPDERSIEQFWHIGARNSGNWIRQCFNVSPSMVVPMVKLEAGAIQVVPARWGLIPPWWRDESLPAKSFNARSEEAAGKPMWRQSLRAQRCLMPASGWYEWNEKEPASNPSGKPCNQPYFLCARETEVLAIAGLWARWRNLDGEEVLSCALLTKSAAPSIQTVHHRMPVILKPEQIELWLDPRTASGDVQLLIENCREDFVARRISTYVNDPGNDCPELLNELVS